MTRDRFEVVPCIPGNRLGTGGDRTERRGTSKGTQLLFDRHQRTCRS